ncbi:MAG: hypothetical protein CFK52_06745 [Chloracidobacterium sp. CP2_5A]|nr:MAG: hypothetical protein CFK52_06745 [Chloracidobacterium sp. CP2_5A]
MSSEFIWLGQSLSASFGVGSKASLLDQATAAGLPVPRGGVLLEAFFALSLREGNLRRTEDGFAFQDAAAIREALPVLALPPKLAVRSAFSAEDGLSESFAGRFDSVLNVAPDELPDALCKVWASSLRHASPLRRDVLIMAMVEARQAGVAITEPSHEDDVVNFTPGLADRLVSGAVAGETLSLPKLRVFESPTESGFAGRLQALLREVRRVFGEGSWDVEFADDGRQCWLIQARPLTRPVTRNEWFTYANHREILPPLPSRFMTSLIASCAGDLFDYYRGFDPRLPGDRPFIEVFAGRPFINLSLLLDMMRRWGLPTRLVTDSIGGRDVCAQGWRWGRLWRSLPTLLRLGWSQLLAASSAQRRIAWLAEVGGAPARSDSFANCISDLRMAYTALVREMFSLTQAISGPLAILRRLGALAPLAARHETMTTRMFNDLNPLRDYARRHPAVATSIAQGKVPDDEGFGRLWQAYLDRYGFRGVFESDIAQPRYRERPETLLASLATEPRASSAPPVPWLAWLALPVWRQARGALDARERLRHAAMQAFDRIRQRLLRLAVVARDAGKLPTTDALWLLEVDELARLDGDWSVAPDFLAARRREQEADARYDFPDVFRRFDDFSAFGSAALDEPGPRHVQGIGLTRGLVEGRAWVCEAPTLPPPFSDPVILVARAVDAGWIAVFSAVAGVVVEIGGDLSHGSIALREIGLPSVTNARGATRVIQTGDWIRVRADIGSVELVEPAARSTSLASAPAGE